MPLGREDKRALPAPCARLLREGKTNAHFAPRESNARFAPLVLPSTSVFNSFLLGRTWGFAPPRREDKGALWVRPLD